MVQHIPARAVQSPVSQCEKIAFFRKEASEPESDGAECAFRVQVKQVLAKVGLGQRERTINAGHLPYALAH